MIFAKDQKIVMIFTKDRLIDKIFSKVYQIDTIFTTDRLDLLYKRSDGIIFAKYQQIDSLQDLVYKKLTDR